MASQKPAELQGGNQSKRQTHGKDNLSKETEKSEYTETRLQYRINTACIFSWKKQIQRIHLRPWSNCAATGKSATKPRHRTPSIAGNTVSGNLRVKRDSGFHNGKRKLQKTREWQQKFQPGDISAVRTQAVVATPGFYATYQERWTFRPHCTLEHFRSVLYSVRGLEITLVLKRKTKFSHYFGQMLRVRHCSSTDREETRTLGNCSRQSSPKGKPGARGMEWSPS